MVERFGIKVSSGHIDGTSISVEGKYIQSEEKQKESAAEKGEEKEEEDEPVPITINHGYSRDHRPDLKQFTLSLLTTGGEGIPLFLQVGDGNKLDSQAFPEMIKAFQSQWQGEKLDLFVIDAAFYEEENLIESKEKTNWLSRVPLTIKAAQELTKTLLPDLSRVACTKIIVFVQFVVSMQGLNNSGL
jgi:transposase